MKIDDAQAISREIVGKADCSAACPIHGFEFVTMSDGDGHPSSWYDFCDHESHEEEKDPPELISGNRYLIEKFATALMQVDKEARAEQREIDAKIAEDKMGVIKHRAFELDNYASRDGLIGPLTAESIRSQQKESQ